MLQLHWSSVIILSMPNCSLFDQQTQWLLTNLLGSPCVWPFSTLSLKLMATSSESPQHFLKSVLFVGLSCSPDFPPLKFTLQFHLPVFLSSSSLTPFCVNSIRQGPASFLTLSPSTCANFQAYNKSSDLVSEWVHFSITLFRFQVTKDFPPLNVFSTIFLFYLLSSSASSGLS